MRRMLAVLSAAVLVSGACSNDGSSTDAVTQAEAPAEDTQAVAEEAPAESPEPTATPEPESPEPTATSESEPEAPTAPAGTDAGEPDLGVSSDELCEVLPTAEIGAVVNADAQVTTFGAGPGVICDVGISFPGTTVHVIVELLNRGGEEGFEEGVDREATLFNLDPIDITGVGDAAAGFSNGVIIVLSGQSVVRIGGSPEELVDPELEEIGRLIAASLA